MYNWGVMNVWVNWGDPYIYQFRTKGTALTVRDGKLWNMFVSHTEVG